MIASAQSFPLHVFAMNTSRRLGEEVARSLGSSLSPHEEREFEAGEHKSRPLRSVRGADVYVISSLDGEKGASANDKLLRMLFFIGALNDARAARVTAIVPYLCYSRKDRRTKVRDPVTTRYVARLFEAVGTDVVLTVDVHNVSAFENAFSCPTEHITAIPTLIERIRQRGISLPVTVVSPDVGGAKRAEACRKHLAAHLGDDVPLAFVEKERSEGIVRGGSVVGRVQGRTVVIVDDLISSGTTLVQAARACRAQGANSVIAAVTHGLFAPEAGVTLAHPSLDAVYVTNSVSASRLPTGHCRTKVVRVDISRLLAEVIHRMHNDDSLSHMTDVYVPERKVVSAE
ncbi:ribose-phosphate pyrophosphokinase [Longibacter salinarum]|uniref:ribose-phosphate diphosphokinase n=1 Tax=Longibacter salinarum TaxID=1850348 RepID=A0A2A8CWD5_9BACT|nr:ribose-phosphate pyrophosphokinase [Longibacter salinarum]PEN12933.1 ribose-phosphate pyrophosphokinase [Longibacter salinarum]